MLIFVLGFVLGFYGGMVAYGAVVVSSSGGERPDAPD